MLNPNSVMRLALDDEKTPIGHNAHEVRFTLPVAALEPSDAALSVNEVTRMHVVPLRELILKSPRDLAFTMRILVEVVTEGGVDHDASPLSWPPVLGHVLKERHTACGLDKRPALVTPEHSCLGTVPESDTEL
jgi:hypothetical protein